MASRKAAEPSDAPPTRDDSSNEPEPGDQDTARTAGRGFLVITAAKLYFMVTGAAIQLGLPILFGEAQQFGVFKLVTEAISLINMVVITATLQAVAKLVSEDPRRARQVVHQALRLQLMLGIPLALLYALGSPWVASEFFHDESLTPLMRISSIIIAAYAFYAIFVGYLNGVKSFVQQAVFDITFQTFKTAGILGLVVLGFGVWGAVSGFVGAAVAISILSAVWVLRTLRLAHRDQPGPEPDPENERLQRRRLLGFLASVMLYTFALNGLMRADLFLIKSIAADPGELAQAGLTFQIISNKFAGFYGAALNLARLPFQGVIAVTFVIFPLISEATFQEDAERTRTYIQNTFRYCTILIAAVALPLIFNSDSVIAALYSADYRAASTALAILSVAIIFFALLYVAATIIIGAGRPMVAVIIMGISLLISAVANSISIQRVHEATLTRLGWTTLPTEPVTSPQAAVAQAIQSAAHETSLAGPYLTAAPDYMTAAAIATAIAMFTGFVLALVWIGRTYRATVPLATVARILLAAAGMALIDQLLFPTPVEWVDLHGKLVYLGIVACKMATMGITLLVVLGLTREFGEDDRAKFLAVLGKKRKT